MIEALVNMGPRIGFSALVSSGTEVATSCGEYLEYFARDDATGAACVFLEGFRDPEAFIRGAKAMRAAGKPLAVLQAGRSAESAAAIAAHSGTLAGADEVVTGLIGRASGTIVRDNEIPQVVVIVASGRVTGTFIGADGHTPIANAQVVLTTPARWFELPASESMRPCLQTRWPNSPYIGNPVDPGWTRLPAAVRGDPPVRWPTRMSTSSGSRWTR